MFIIIERSKNSSKRSSKKSRPSFSERARTPPTQSTRRRPTVRRYTDRTSSPAYDEWEYDDRHRHGSPFDFRDFRDDIRDIEEARGFGQYHRGESSRGMQSQSAQSTPPYRYRVQRPRYTHNFTKPRSSGADTWHQDEYVDDDETARFRSGPRFSGQRSAPVSGRPHMTSSWRDSHMCQRNSSESPVRYKVYEPERNIIDVFNDDPPDFNMVSRNPDFTLDEHNSRYIRLLRSDDTGLRSSNTVGLEHGWKNKLVPEEFKSTEPTVLLVDKLFDDMDKDQWLTLVRPAMRTEEKDISTVGNWVETDIHRGMERLSEYYDEHISRR